MVLKYKPKPKSDETLGIDPTPPIQNGIYLMTVGSLISVYTKPWLPLDVADGSLVLRAHMNETLDKQINMVLIWEVNVTVVGSSLEDDGDLEDQDPMGTSGQEDLAQELTSQGPITPAKKMRTMSPIDTDVTQHPNLGIFVAREEKHWAHAAEVIVGIQADQSSQRRKWD